MMGGAPRILVIGYNAFDMTVPIDGFAEPDTKKEVSAIPLGGGGPGATAAVALARLGARVKLVTPLTDDLPGLMQQQELARAGVDHSSCPVLEGHETAKAVILVDPLREQRTIYWSRGNLPHLKADQVDAGWLEEVDLLYLDGHEPFASLELARAACSRRLPVVMDAGSVREGSAELVAVCTDVISSEIFAPRLTGRDEPLAALQALRERGPARVGMTFGAGGVLGLAEDGPVAVPSYAVEVLDTTGAGDAFHAGYALARALDQGFVAALRFGSAVAALKCRMWGGRRGLPDRNQAEEMVRTGPTRPLDSRLAPFGPD